MVYLKQTTDMFSIMSQLSHISTTSYNNSIHSNDTILPSTTNINGFFNFLHCHFYLGLSLFRKYEKVLETAHEAKLRIKFLRECIEEQVLPRSITTRDNHQELPFPPTYKLALEDKIVLQKRELGKLFQDVREARNAYRRSLPEHMHEDLHRIAIRTVNHRINRLRLQHRRKLLALI